MPDDPRNLHGDISGPGGPHDEGGVVLDATKAILLDMQMVARIDQGARGQEAFALLLGGRINQTADRAQVLFMAPLDGFAALITELHGVARRAGRGDELARLCAERWEEMP